MSKQPHQHHHSHKQQPEWEEDYHHDPPIKYDNATINARAPRNDLLLSDFNDLKPYLTKEDPKTSSPFANVKDNTFSDYNEEGQNDVNNSQYRKEMIARSVLETMQTVNIMFSTSERTNSQTGYADSNTCAPFGEKQKMSRHRATEVISKFNQTEEQNQLH